MIVLDASLFQYLFKSHMRLNEHSKRHIPLNPVIHSGIENQKKKNKKKGGGVKNVDKNAMPFYTTGKINPLVIQTYAMDYMYYMYI